MNEKNFVLYEWNNETKEFWFLGEKIDYIHNPSEWKKYLNDLVSENKELQQKVNQLETNRDEAIELLSKGVAFCENDSQGAYDVCNNAINREKKVKEILERGKK